MFLGSCNVQKRAKPCQQCPHFSKINYIKLEYYRLNPKYKKNITSNGKSDKNYL